VALNEKGVFRGKLEIDFVDFTKASPTVASVPRLRIATIDWLPTNAITLSVGQDWDLFSPVVPHGANLVGGNFNAGNAGFMRQQIKLLGKVGSRLELAGAVGFAGVNATSKDGPIELGLLPSVALRATVLLDKYGKLGASGIAAPVLFSQGAPAERRAVAAAGNVFADLSFSTTQLRGEWYVAQNLANIGALTLAYGTTATDVQEMGGYVSIRQALNEMNFIYGRAGIARVMNPAAVVPSYRYASLPADGSPPATSTATLAGTGPGIRGNLALVAGYELRVLKPLAFHLEGFFFRTEHALLEVDSARFSTVRFVGGAELTAMLTL
jgi:hypothetical protein